MARDPERGKLKNSCKDFDDINLTYEIESFHLSRSGKKKF